MSSGANIFISAITPVVCIEKSGSIPPAAESFFNVVRDTQTYEIHESYLIGTQPAGRGTPDSDSTEVQAS